MEPFWLEVSKAYDQVYNSKSQEVTVELNGKRAIVTWYDDPRTGAIGYVNVIVYDIPILPPTLVAP